MGDKRFLKAVENIKKCTAMLVEEKQSAINEDIKTYLQYYKLPAEGITYHYGFEKSCNEHIFIQSFSPSYVKARVLLLHGYYDHAGMLSTTIRFLIHHQFQVITFDLPGHGLSTGARANISHFLCYRTILSDIAGRCLRSNTLPAFLVAHSTGAAIAADYFLSSEPVFPIQKAIFVSPLIRSSNWKMTKIGTAMLKPFMQDTKRIYRANTSNKEHMNIMRKDPLQYGKVPLNWVQALINWNRQIERSPLSLQDILILQGEKDTTVDWRYNVPFLCAKFPQAKVIYIPDGKHHLLNEKDDIQNTVFSSIGHYLLAEEP